MSFHRPSLDGLLDREINAVRRRLVARNFALGAALMWLAQAFLVWLVADSLVEPLARPLLILLLAVSGLAAVVGSLIVWRWSVGQFRSGRSIAKPLEARFPELDARLFAAVERWERTEHSFGFLDDQVLREVLVLARRQNWRKLVPAWELWLARGAGLVGFVVVMAASLSLVFAPFSLPSIASSSQQPLPPAATSAETWEVIPGDVDLQKGSSLLVTVKLPAPSPDPVQMVVLTDSGETASFELNPTLSDPIYAGQVPNVQQSITYRIETGSSATRDFRVTVYELPELKELNIELEYPSFTNLAPKTVLDPRRLQAVEGTEIKMLARFNQSLKHAKWKGPSGEIDMKPVPGERDLYQGTLTLEDTQKLELDILSPEGRSAAAPTSLKLTALPNKPVEIRWMQPGFDPQVSPLEEVDVAGQATDDFGVANFGLTYQLVGRDPVEISLGAEPVGDEKIEDLKATIREQVAMETLQVKPGDLMQLYLWAEDRVRDGSTRRAFSDLIVAEVREFEQIFRQSDEAAQPQQQNSQQPQGQGGEQQQAKSLIERQKQLLLASWNLARRRPDADGWKDDVQLVLEQQMSIVDEARPMIQAVAAAEDVQVSPEELLLYQQALVDAVQRLLEGIQQLDPESVQSATEAQQIILQGLMQLVGNEFDVQQQSQQGQPGSPSSSRQAGSPSQQQLQQLQLDNERNRYEQESEAQTITDPEQEELRQMLSRLEDLARRQEDLNEQIQQLQTQLEAAETEEEKEDLKRRLERLREEQEQLLRDAEELQEDFSQDPNASQEDRQQLEQARESAQQSAQSLANDDVDQALAEGRRAEQALDQLQDEIRQRTGNAFQQELNRLNQQLSDLTQAQENIENDLERFFDDESADLKDRDRTTPLLDQMDDRNRKLEEVLNDLQNVIEASEESEPLLSDELYEAFREAKQRQVEEMGEESERWTRNGLPERSVPLEEALGDKLDELRESVSRSSQFAGTDAVSALRMAESRLRELSSEVDPSSSEGGEGSEPNENSETGENPGEGEPGEREPDEGEPGEGQSEQSEQQSQSGEGTPANEQQEAQPGSGREPSDGQPSESQAEDAQQPGQSPSEQSPMGQSPMGQSPMGQSPMGQSPMGQGGQPSEEPSDSQQPSQSPQSGSPQSGTRPGEQENRLPSNSGGSTGGSPNGPLSAENFLDRWSDLTGPNANPLTGDNYRDWVDRLREVEDLVPIGPLRDEATRIRQRAEEMRRELKRHSKVPDPQDIDNMLVKPLDSLARAVAAERMRLEGNDRTIRLDRDVVPAEFEDEVREYFQRLGAGRE